MNKYLFGAFLGAFFLPVIVFGQTKIIQPVYQDKPYLQDYSVKYYTQNAKLNDNFAICYF
jgi:hypothetical protein